MKNEVLAYLKELIEKKYGTLDDERGAFLNGKWLSIAEIVQLIDKADEEYYP